MKKVPSKAAIKENPVYLKLEYDEAVESKRILLSTEINLLAIVKIIRNYHKLREEEFYTKMQLFKALKELNPKMRRITISFPAINVPEKIKEEPIIKERKEKSFVEKKKDDGIESQLRDIQEKLRAIGR